MMNRRAELIISILATLKVGAGYLPIDPSYPEDRIKYIIEDSNVKLLLTEKQIENKYKIESINVDDIKVYDKYENKLRRYSLFNLYFRLYRKAKRSINKANWSNKFYFCNYRQNAFKRQNYCKYYNYVL